MEKFTEKFKKYFSSDESLKRIPSYLFLLSVVLIVLVVMLFKINNNLEIIANNSGKEISPIVKDENYESVLDTFTEDYQTIDSIIPYASDVPTEKTDDSKTEASDEVKSTEQSTSEINKTEPTSHSSDTVSKTTYVINTSSNKIHFADCTFAVRTKEENKKTVTLTVEEMNDYLNSGYTFCKTCGGK